MLTPRLRGAEGRDLLYGRNDLLRRDQPGTFELAVVALVAGTPEEIEVVEVLAHIVPAAVAGVVVDDPVGRVELVGGMGEPRDHHDRHLAAPGHPRQPAGKPDEEVGVLDEIHPLLQGAVPREVLRAVGDVVPVQPHAVDLFLVDAKDAIAVVLEELDDRHPAEGVVPVFRLTGALGRDADVFFLDLPGGGEVEAGRQVVQIVPVQPEDVARRPVEPDVAEVDGLIVHIAPEEESHVIGGVGLVLHRLFGRDEGDVGILVLDQRGDPRRHDADELAAVFLLEPFHITEPADGVPDGPHGQLDHDLLVFEVHVVLEDGFLVPLFVDDEPELDVEFFHGRHEGARLSVVAVEDDAGVDVEECDVIDLVVPGEEDSYPVVEVELDPLDGVHHGDLRNLAVDGLLGSFGPLLPRSQIGIPRGVADTGCVYGCNCRYVSCSERRGSINS